MYHHPKYYKELRKQRRDSTEALPRNGESLVPEEAPSTKPQASSFKHGGRRERPTVINEIHDEWAQDNGYKASSSKRQASSPKQEASSSKPQAASSLIREPRNI